MAAPIIRTAVLLALCAVFAACGGEAGADKSLVTKASILRAANAVRVDVPESVGGSALMQSTIRISAIENLIAAGVFTKIDIDNKPATAWTGPRWGELEYDVKQACSRAAYVFFYAKHKSMGDLEVRSGTSDTIVGTFPMQTGVYLEK